MIKPLSDFMLFYVIFLLFIFTKLFYYYYFVYQVFFLFFFMKIIVIFSCSGTVPECSVFLVLSTPGGKSVARLLNRFYNLTFWTFHLIATIDGLEVSVKSGATL